MFAPIVITTNIEVSFSGEELIYVNRIVPNVEDCLKEGIQ